VPHTSKYRPWRLKTYVAFSDEKQGLAFERYLKSASGRAFAKSGYSARCASFGSAGLPARQACGCDGWNVPSTCRIIVATQFGCCITLGTSSKGIRF
jgi:hypothetical protein